MSSHIQALILVAFAALSNAIPIDEYDLKSATSYAFSNIEHKDSGNDISISKSSDSDFGEFEVEDDHSYHISAPITTHHVVTPIIEKVPILIKKEEVYHEEERHEPKKYEFRYAVEDKHTGDIKSQKEASDGHVVKGEYSLKEADGTIRVVKYSADKKNGFNAVVIRKGHATHPQVEHKKIEVKKVIVPIVQHHDDNFGHIFSHY